jgi:hypothetical protein
MKSSVTVTLFLRVSPALKERIESVAKQPSEHGRDRWDRKTTQQVAIEALEAAFPARVVSGPQLELDELASPRKLASSTSRSARSSSSRRRKAGAR